MFLELFGTWNTWQAIEYQHSPAKVPSGCSTNVQQASWRSVRRVGGTKKFVCKRCGRGYMWSSALKRHTNLECNKEPTYQCPYCPLRTRQLCSMKRHLKNKHQSWNLTVDMHEKTCFEVLKPRFSQCILDSLSWMWTPSLKWLFWLWIFPLCPFIS